jgi:CHAT domain-containing protein
MTRHWRRKSTQRGACRTVVGVSACLALVTACRGAPERTSATRHAALDSLVAAGESLFLHEQYDSARVIWRASLPLARAARDEEAEARVLTSMSFASYRLGDFNDARKTAELSLAVARGRAPSRNLARTYSVLGLLTLNDGRAGEASRLLEKAMEVARATNDSDVLMRASGNLGLAAMNLGDTRRARDAHRTQRQLARMLGDAQVEGNSFTNEANVDIWEGNPRPAIARLDSARVLYERVGFATGQQHALTVLATAFEETGDVGAAFAALDTAIVLARRLGMKSQEAEALRLLGEMHLSVGDYRRAVDYAEQAESQLATTGYESQRPGALRISADAYLRLGNLTRASANARRALQLDSIAGERFDQLDDLLLLAQIAYRQSGLTNAEPRLRSALALADQLGTRGSRIAVAVTEAHLAGASHNPQRVLRALRGAGPDIAAGDFGAAWETSALAARAYAELNELDSAVAAGRRAVTAVERLRGVLASQALRSTYVADRADVYGDLAITLLRLGRVDDAFAVADAARSGELVRRLGSARDDARSGRLPHALLESEDLLRRIDDLVRRLRDSEQGRPRERGEAGDSADVALATELERARSEYEALSIRLAQERPPAASVLGSDPVRPDEVRKSLEADEALLDYLVARDQVIVFVATRSGLTVVRRELESSGVTQRVRLLHDLWRSPTANWQSGLGLAKALHDALIAPVRDAGLLRGVRRLIIVPHGVLAQVPFPALVDANTQRYLVQDFTVTVLPSAAALPTLRRVAASRSTWAGMGIALAPFPDELPATRGEVEAFGTFLPRATLRLGREATEAELRRSLTLGIPVHIASHAVINGRNPMFSRIELARLRNFVPDDDGRLEVHELLGLTVRSPLVFLSGCETGAGYEWTDDPVKGTGELTLAQAFLSAGAANVILTLWRIDDAGAAEFAKGFYSRLPHLSVGAALAETQRQMATGGRYSNPYYWAGYLLTGSGTQETSDPSVSVLSGGLAGDAGQPASRR